VERKGEEIIGDEWREERTLEGGRERGGGDIDCQLVVNIDCQ
jgi:hypothetical protein